MSLSIRLRILSAAIDVPSLLVHYPTPPGQRARMMAEAFGRFGNVLYSYAYHKRLENANLLFPNQTFRQRQVFGTFSTSFGTSQKFQDPF